MRRGSRARIGPTPSDYETPAGQCPSGASWSCVLAIGLSWAACTPHPETLPDTRPSTATTGSPVTPTRCLNQRPHPAQRGNRHPAPPHQPANLRQVLLSPPRLTRHPRPAGWRGGVERHRRRRRRPGPRPAPASPTYSPSQAAQLPASTSPTDRQSGRRANASRSATPHPPPHQARLLDPPPPRRTRRQPQRANPRPVGDPGVGPLWPRGVPQLPAPGTAPSPPSTNWSLA